MIRRLKVLSILLLFLGAYSCKTYKSNIMFKTKDFENDPSIESSMKKAEENYRLKINDKITLKVETNSGEALIDPNKQMRKELTGSSTNQSGQNQEEIDYLVEKDGTVNLPMLGYVKLVGFSIHQVDSLLVTLYNNYYEKPFVKSAVSNRRVTVFLGQTAQVVPINNEEMNLIEVIALAGGMNDDTKASNIRLIRGDLNNPYVEVIDLSTIQGMQKATLKVRANDIVYIEPVRKVANEAIKDIVPLLTFATSLLAIAVIIANL